MMDIKILISEPPLQMIFNSELCIKSLFKKFVLHLSVYSKVAPMLIQLIQADRNDANYFWCIKTYLIQILNSGDISQDDFNRVCDAFQEQSVNLLEY